MINLLQRNQVFVSRLSSYQWHKISLFCSQQNVLNYHSTDQSDCWGYSQISLQLTITLMCSVYRKMNLETLQISSVIKKPPDERSREDLEEILPYLTKRSELLSNLQKGKRSELLSNLQKGTSLKYVYCCRTASCASKYVCSQQIQLHTDLSVCSLQNIIYLLSPSRASQSVYFTRNRLVGQWTRTGCSSKSKFCPAACHCYTVPYHEQQLLLCNHI